MASGAEAGAEAGLPVAASAGAAAGPERRVFWAAMALTIALDFITKLIAEATLLRTSISVFGDWFRLRLVHNPGAAFGLHIGPYSRWFFLVVAIIAVVVLAQMSRTSPAGDRLRQLALGLVAGGAAGNLIDRIRSPRGVVDFLDIGIGVHRWPTFNVADIAVSCGAVALAIMLWREDAHRARGGAGDAAHDAAHPPPPAA